MFCAKCGAPMTDGSQFCNQCGQSVSAPIIPQENVASAPPPAAPPPAASSDAPTSGKALGSMISGILGLILFVPAIAAVILGHLSRAEIRKSNGRLQGNGMAIAGLVMGYMTLASLPFILIIAAIAIPNLLRARIAANETSAVSTVRQIVVAEVTYQVTYPALGYTCRLSSLGGKGDGTPSAERAQLLEDRIVSAEHYGYRFVLQNCVNTDTDHKYQVVAYPRTRNQTGVRTFCSDESGIIKVGESEEDCLTSGSPL